MTTNNTTPSRQYLAFHGDYSALKGMGFKFQKLYANNYMQWELETQKHLSSIRIWKRGGDVTVDELTNYEGSFFAGFLALREKGETPRTPRFAPECIEFIKDTQTHTAHFDNEAFARFHAQRQAVYAYMDKVDARCAHIDGIEARSEAAKQDGIDFPAQRYQSACIRMVDIKPVIDMIDKGWITIGTRPLKKDA